MGYLFKQKDLEMKVDLRPVPGYTGLYVTRDGFPFISVGVGKVKPIEVLYSIVPGRDVESYIYMEDKGVKLPVKRLVEMAFEDPKKAEEQAPKPPRKRPFICLENGQIFSSKDSAARFFKTNSYEIDKALRDYDYAACNIWHFQYMENYESRQPDPICLETPLEIVN